jgi:GNAT superfamily N-acetyltransferase
MPEQIVEATTPEDFAAFAALVRAYVDWCRERYHDDIWFVEQVFGHQSLESELQNLAAAYSPPRGRTLLAWRDGQLCGCGAYRKLSDGSFELKRLFVPARFQGQGTGRRLSAALVAAAQNDGAALLRLDTAHRLTEAIALYKSLGFVECPAYQDYPERFMPYLVFMELPLD